MLGWLMTEPQKLISLLQQEFEKHLLVEAFVLVGSQAREDVYVATQYSDMEVYLVTKDENAATLEKELPELLAQTGKILFTFKHTIGFVAVYEDLFRLELPVIKESELEKLFSRPKAQVVKVLIDKTGGKLEKVLANRPDEIDYAQIFSDKVTNFWFWQIVAVQYFKKGEFHNTRAVLGIHASALIWMFELLNDPKVLLLETNKRIEKFLLPEQLSHIKDIPPAYDQDAIYNSLIKTMDLFSNLTMKIKEKYGYKFDESLKPKVEPLLLELLQK